MRYFFTIVTSIFFGLFIYRVLFIPNNDMEDVFLKNKWISKVTCEQCLSKREKK